MIQVPEELLRFKSIDTQHDIPNAIRKVQRMKTHDASGLCIKAPHLPVAAFSLGQVP